MPKPVPLARRLAPLRLPPAPLAPAALPLMLPVAASEIPRGEGWLFEIKWDGVRALLLRRAGVVTVWARSGAEITRHYPETVAAVAALAGGDLALDAEIVALDDEGRPSFQRLQARMHGARQLAAAVRRTPVVTYVYDCLVLTGLDLRTLPLRDRKACLRELVSGDGVLRYCEHVVGDGTAVLAAVARLGLEGIVAKRVDSPYRGGRRAEWCKISCVARQEFVIGGWTDPRGTRAHFGALHLGVHDGAALAYVGKVGSSVPSAELAAVARALAARATERCPFTAGTPPSGRAHHWVRPELVCEVRFTAWTRDGSVRAPVFLGLRDDKPAREVRRDPSPAIGARVSGARGRTPAAGRGSGPLRPRVRR